MLDVEVIERPDAAAAALEPTRRQLLAELREPASAATLAARLGLKRQRVNYHLHALEEHGLIAVADTRQWGGLTERLMVATAAAYVVSPEALGPVAADPAQTKDRLAASYLIALGARIVREVGSLWRRARQADQHLATLSVDTEICFATPEDRASFTRDVNRFVTELAGRYHHPSAPGGRPHRLVVVSYPVPKPHNEGAS
jgi:DNA-binding transcriptional ArsR family regulator